MRFHFMRYFVCPVCPIGYCIVHILSKLTLKIKKARNVHTSSKVSQSRIINVKLSMQSLPMPTLLMVKKIPILEGKSWGMMLYLSNAPLN